MKYFFALILALIVAAVTNQNWEGEIVMLMRESSQTLLLLLLQEIFFKSYQMWKNLGQRE